MESNHSNAEYLLFYIFPTSSPGRYYRRGEIFWLSDQCSQRCRCLDIHNEVQCQEAPCGQLETCEQQEGAFYCQPTRTSTCVVFGDPHYHTFDGFLYHFQGTCSYLLARPCWEIAGLPFFSVEAKNENRGVASVSWLRDVTVEVYGHRVILPKGSLGTVQVRICGPLFISGIGLLTSYRSAPKFSNVKFGERLCPCCSCPRFKFDLRPFAAHLSNPISCHSTVNISH